MQVNSRFFSLAFSSALAVLTLAAMPAQAAHEHAGAVQKSGAASALGPRLAGHVPSAMIARAHLLGRIASAQTVSLALTLPVRNPAALSDLLGRLYTPGDPLYGRYLTPSEFAARFGPTEADYAAVIASAKAQGLTITGTHPNRLLVDVSGPASAVETAFNLTLSRYQSAEGREFYAPALGPILPGGMAGRVAGVVGLDNAVRLRPHLHPLTASRSLLSRAGTGPYGGLSPSDIKTAYSLQSAANGAGQTIALYELDGYAPSDITAYEAQFGLPAVPLQNILVDGATGTPGANTDEVTLDIELAQALAPSLSKILVYETPNTLATTTQSYLDGYSRIADDNLAKQISTSWGYQEDGSGTALLTGENTIFQQMAAQGQTIVAVTGDNGAYDDGATLSLDDPGSQPYVTGVGGTTLATNGTGGPYASESAWSGASDPANSGLLGYSAFGIGGGGGFSAVWPTPSYQTALLPAPPTRSVPDVALNADPQTGYAIYTRGTWTIYGGTSAAAPLWAGFAALVNQGRAAAGKAPIGFLNPPIYAIGASAAYTADFHDVTTGTNLYYPATAGYDNASGWGSFVGDALLGTLVNGLAAASSATLSGTITAADTGSALAGVTVSAVSSPGGASVGTATTDASGNYTLAVPSATALVVTISAYNATNGGYAGAKVSQSALPTGGTATVSAALQPAHTFPAGLRLISSPYDYSAVGDFSAIFGFSATSGAFPRLVAWDPNAFSYIFYPNAPANTLTPGRGYWALFPAAAYPHFDGALVPTAAPFQHSLSTGWNLIGDPFPAAVPLSSVTVSGTPLVSSASVSPTLYRYDTPSAQYVAVSVPTDSLQPYTGYWIYANQAVTLGVPAP